MRLGISLTSFHATDDVRAGARWMIERAAAAREAGLDSLFIGDHHVMPAPYYQNTPMLGRLLAEWDERPAGCLFLMPLWSPVLLAEQVGTLASIARGRFIIQCAIGDGPGQFAGMGVDIKKRPSMFEEGIDIVRRLLAGERVSSSGRYHIEGARVNPLPPEPVEFWVGGSADIAIDRAARVGDGFLGAPNGTPERCAHEAAVYLDACKRHGRTPTAVALRRDVYVGATASEARAIGEQAIAQGYRGFEAGALTFGDVEEVAAQFTQYAAMGYTDIIVRHLVDDQDLVLGSLRRLADVRRLIASA
ncbi:MAG: LLM class flavin-dependent oxidoreductase [Dehalococcoidia bacterium]|nr:LLM class flavin-dependent oxidoreductase [Dehalococcoidia bacterium]